MNIQAQREHIELLKQQDQKHPKIISEAKARRDGAQIREDLALAQELDRIMGVWNE